MFFSLVRINIDIRVSNRPKALFALFDILIVLIVQIRLKQNFFCQKC